VAPRNSNGFSPNMQDSDQLSANVVWVRSGNQDLFIDPGSKYFAYPLLPWYETGVEGLRLEKQGGTNIAVPLNPPADAVRERRADVRIEEDGTLSGKLEITYFRQWGCAMRYDDREDDEAGKKKNITDEVKGWLPSSATFEITSMTGWDKLDDPIHVEGTLRIPGFATSAGHRVLVPLTFFQAIYPASFQHEYRSNAVYFHFPAIEKDSLSIHMPGAYKIETLPPPSHATPGASFEYSLASTQDGDVVKVERQLTIGGGIMFPVANYRVFRSFFNTVKTDDDGQIVLQLAPGAKSD